MREDRRRAPSPDRHRALSSDRPRAPSTSVAASGSCRKSRREATVYRAVNTAFKEPIHKLLSKINTQPFFKWPQPMRGDPFSRDHSKFCVYHKQNGQRTKDCKALKAHLETLVKDRHLLDHLKEECRDPGPGVRARE